MANNGDTCSVNITEVEGSTTLRHVARAEAGAVATTAGDLSATGKAINEANFSTVLSAVGGGRFIVNGNFRGENRANGNSVVGIETSGNDSVIRIRGNATVEAPNGSALRVGRSTGGGLIDIGGGLNITAGARGLNSDSSGAINVRGPVTITSGSTGVHAQNGTKIEFSASANLSPDASPDSSIIIRDSAVTIAVNGSGAGDKHGLNAQSANGAAQVLVDSPSAVITTRNGIGIRANSETSSSVDFSGSSIVTVGTRAFGITSVVSGAGQAQIYLRRGAVSTSGLEAHGLRNVVQGAGDLTNAALVEIRGGSVTTTGAGAHAVLNSTSGGRAEVVMSGGTLSTSGDEADGIKNSNGAGSAIVQMQGGSISTAGRQSQGIDNDAREGDATVVLSDGAISTSGDRSNGVVSSARNGTSLVDVGGGSIRTSGNDSEGVLAGTENNGSDVKVAMSAGTITTRGEDADGIVVMVNANGRGQVQMSGGTVATTGGGSAGIVAEGAFGIFTAHTLDVEQTGGTITTSGDSVNLQLSAGIVALGKSLGNTTVAQSGRANIITSGERAHGIYATSGGTTVVTQGVGSLIRASGIDAYGIRAIGQPSLFSSTYAVGVEGEVIGGSGNGAAVSVSGSSGTVVVGASGRLSAASGVAIVDEAGLGLVSNGALSVRSSGLIDGDILTGEGKDSVSLLDGSVTRGAILLDNGQNNGSDQLTIAGRADISGVTVMDGGDDVFDTDGRVDVLSFVDGTHEYSGDKILNFEQLQVSNADLRLMGSGVRVGSGAGTPNGKPMGINIEADSSLAIVPNDFTITGNLTNAGLLSLENGSVTNRLRLLADPAGVAGATGVLNGLGGTIAIETVLGDQNSPTDRIIIDGGSVVGNSLLGIRNLGGGGALTLDDGILLVDAINGGTTNQDAFALSQIVMAGPFEYQLFRSGAAADTSDNWYLRSVDRTPPTPEPPKPQPPEPQPPKPQPPTPQPPTPEPPKPIIRSEVPAYTLASELVYRMGIVEVGTFNERRGDRGYVTLDADHNRSPYWMRAYGETSGFNADAVLTGTEFNLRPRFEGAIMGLQAGADILAYGDEHGNEHRAGLFYSMATGFGQTYGNVRNKADLYASALSLNSHGLGAYYTLHTEAGFYLDAVGIVSAISGGAYSETGLNAAINGMAYTASLEIGQDIALAEGWTLQPQAQVIWRQTNLNGTSDAVSSVDFVDIGEFTARLGLRLENASKWNDREVISHVGANLWHTPEHANGARVGTWDVVGKSSNTSIELNAGISVEINENNRAFGNISYTVPLDGYSDPGLAFQVGFKGRF